MGTESFGRAYADPLPFDQQPLEAQATIEACEAAFDATGDARWVDEATRAYRWYLGQNDLDLPLATSQDGGCFDGLMPTGLNRNQGAEFDSGAAIGILHHFGAFKAGGNRGRSGTRSCVASLATLQRRYRCEATT